MFAAPANFAVTSSHSLKLLCFTRRGFCIPHNHYSARIWKQRVIDSSETKNTWLMECARSELTAETGVGLLEQLMDCPKQLLFFKCSS